MTSEEYAELLTWRDSVNSQLAQLHGGHKRISDEIVKNTKLTAETKNTLDILASNLGDLPLFLSEGRVFFKFATKLMKVAKYILIFVVVPIAGIVAVGYAYANNGTPPHWFLVLVEFAKALKGE